ncbi:DUF1559 domain-containing protein [Anatilimnocola sp. NA78]|uniref:DUF1559 family PulG-like putative transporter n=1 Tax=Anatilimnocola sp. NA78 TaxID=3415683 RepID=UPI003CE4497D
MRKRGFTLVELLTVITVLTVLMTLMVLGTGCAVMGDQRDKCRLNIQRLVLGLQNYHDTFLSLPYGARNRTVPPAEEVSWGSSWIVGVLPYCEQKPLFDAIVQVDKDGAPNDYVSAVVLATTAGKDLSTFLCPSSPLPKTQNVAGTALVVPSYAGVMGSQLPNDSRVTAGPYGGNAAGNGMLPLNEALTFAACTDGTANTILLGEVSNWYYDDAGKKQDPSLSIGNGTTGGWLAGTNRGMSAQKQPLGVFGAGADPVPADQVYNLITLKYAPQANNKDGAANQTTPNWGSGGVGRAGLNNPLLSPHGPGALVAYLDGHITLLTNNVSADTVQKLAARDDGQAIPDF